MLKRIFFTLFFTLLLCFIGFQIFIPLYNQNHIIVDYGLHAFDICTEQPVLWKYCKIWFCFTYIFSSFFSPRQTEKVYGNPPLVPFDLRFRICPCDPDPVAEVVLKGIAPLAAQKEGELLVSVEPVADVRTERAAL